MLNAMNDMRFGEFTLSLQFRELRKQGTLLPLSAKAFDLLSYMASNPGRPLSKTELLDAVWPNTIVEEANLSQTVFLLRKVVGSGDDGPIKTLPGRGYQFAAAVHTLEPEGNTAPTPPPHTASFVAETTHTRMFVHQETEERIEDPGAWKASFVRATVAMLVLAGVGWLGWAGWQYWLDRSGGAPLQVVLAPIDGTTGDAVLDMTLTQAMRMDLAQSPYVSVVSGAMVRSTLAQMMHKPNDPMTPEMAREVCERTNSQSVLSGNIVKVGQHYLLTEEANSCVNGSVMASAKYEADKPEELPHAVDKLAARVRQELGESRRSIVRFDTPLVSMNTVSLEALKDYTRASVSMAQGKLPETIALYKAALALDPSFAAAQYDLSMSYFSSGDYGSGRDELKKAYPLRSVATAPVRLAIITAYEAYCTQDLFAAERSYQSWTEMYPRSVQAWNGLSNVERDLGHHAESAAAGLKAIPLAPTFLGLYENAAYEQIRAGDGRGAIATLDRASARHMDDDRLHEMYLDAAQSTNDSSLLQTQLAWVDAHPDAAHSRLQRAVVAIGEGRFAEGRRMFLEVTALLRQQGLPGFANAITGIAAENLLLAGDREESIRLFHSVPFDPEGGDLIWRSWRR